MSRHRWAKRDGETERLVCRRCGVARRRSDGGLYARTWRYVYQQWWGGWHHGVPPCMALDGRRRVWERDRDETQRANQIRIIVEARNEFERMCYDMLCWMADELDGDSRELALSTFSTRMRDYGVIE